MAPRLRPFGTDFGNGPGDRLFFQRDADYAAYADAKLRVSKPGTPAPCSRLRLRAEDEREQWAAITNEFRRRYAREAASAGGGDEAMTDSLKLLLIRRARILKGARAKIPLAGRILQQAYRKGQRWIVYCDNQHQLRAVKEAISHAGIEDVYEYHSAMPGDAARTLEVFSQRGGVIVSIRCLDEGVDIPSVTHALILASSKNPREFIQRRGRVLRRSPGKTLAYVHDVIIEPEADDEEAMGGSILKGELARAIEFGSHAINPAAVADLRRIAAAADLDWQDLTGSGFEIDDEDTESLEMADA